jgi:immunity protein, SdpI family
MRRNYFLIAALLIVATLIVTLIFYPDLPSRIPMHWNWRGQVNRYGDKLEIFLMPAAMVVVVLLFAAMPWLSPRRFEVNTFRSTYLYVMLLALAFMAYIHALHLWVAFSKPLDMNRALLGASFLLLILFGNVLSRVRRNFFIGVRTPWTLSSEKVWDATHRFAAKAFVLAGLLGLLSLVVSASAIAGLVIICGAGLASVLYSLAYYKRLERRNQL